LQVHVVIETSPTGAQVVIAGEVVGETPFEGDLESTEAALTLELRRRDYRTRRITVDMTGGEQQFHERLRRQQPEEPEEPGPANPWETIPHLDLRPGDSP
jgi:hypothetical protein